MQLMGASAPDADGLADVMRSAMRQGRPCMLWCDGDDVSAVVGDEADSLADVLRLAAQVLGVAQ